MFSIAKIEKAKVLPPQFSIQKLDTKTVLIQAVVPEEEQPAAFEDVFDVFSKKQAPDEDWSKVRKAKHLDCQTKHNKYNFMRKHRRLLQ